MAQNKLAGTGKSNSYKHLSDKAIKNKRKYDSEYQKKPSAVKKRVEANRANRQAIREGRARVGDKLDASHTKSGRIVMESQKTNRARNGRNKKSTLK